MHRVARIVSQISPSVSSSTSSSASGMLAAVSPVTGAAAIPIGRILDGQVAIITGSGQGIGAAAALLFAQQGARVVVTDIDAAKSQAVVDQIKAAGGDAISVPGDVTAKEFPTTIINATIK